MFISAENISQILSAALVIIGFGFVPIRILWIIIQYYRSLFYKKEAHEKVENTFCVGIIFIFLGYLIAAVSGINLSFRILPDENYLFSWHSFWLWGIAIVFAIKKIFSK